MMTLDDLGGSKIFQMMTHDGGFGGVSPMMTDDSGYSDLKKIPARYVRARNVFLGYFWPKMLTENFTVNS